MIPYGNRIITKLVEESVTSEVFGVWILIGAALIGAIMVGPRLGKYVKDKAGKVKKVNAIPGHSINLGALG